MISNFLCEDTSSKFPRKSNLKIYNVVCSYKNNLHKKKKDRWNDYIFTMITRSPSSRNCAGSWARMLPPTHPAAKDIQRIYREIHEVSGDVVPINMVKGIGHLRDPRLNKVFKIHLH